MVGNFKALSFQGIADVFTRKGKTHWGVMAAHACSPALGKQRQEESELQSPVR